MVTSSKGLGPKKDYAGEGGLKETTAFVINVLIQISSLSGSTSDSSRLFFTSIRVLQI
jgi:hypothetical protein